MKHVKFWLIILSLLLSSPGFSEGVGFHVKSKGTQTFKTVDKIGRSQMIFISNAPMEDFMGSAAAVSAELKFDPENVTKTIVAKFSVEVKSMTTGLQMRDEDMQGENWLDADKYPTINFSLTKLENTKQTDVNRIEAVAVGNFTMHGITKTISIPITLNYMEENEVTRRKIPGDILILLSKFSVKYSDYGVKGLTPLVGTRVAEHINIEVNIYCSNTLK